MSKYLIPLWYVLSDSQEERCDFIITSLSLLNLDSSIQSYLPGMILSHSSPLIIPEMY